MTVAPETELRGITPEQLNDFQENGYLVLRQFYRPDEVQLLRDTFMGLHAAGGVPGFFEPKTEEEANGDPLQMYPRILHPHRFNDVARRYMLDARLEPVLHDLFGEQPLAAQSMMYFKPSGGRGQALHQDNFFLNVEPGTCIAAWCALDEVDRENGGLEVVPGTHRMDLFCPEEADMSQSFTQQYVPPPPGLEQVPVNMAPGDVLFFNGTLVHGSGPNASKDRFRRSFICHYVPRSTDRISNYYRPLLAFDGSEVDVEVNTEGLPCGTEGPVGPH